MTVAQLIRELKRYNQRQQVYFVYPYGDATGKIVATTPSGVCDGEVAFSPYLEGKQLLPQHRDEREDPKDTKGAVIIKG